MKLDIYNQKGKKTEKQVELTDNLVAKEFNNKLVTEYVVAYLSNQRQSNAHAKTRAEVSGGGKKPWRQKGTGRARAGSSRSPIFTGGGVTFGPRNEANYKKKVNKKVKRIALANVIGKKIEDKKFVVVDKFDLKQTKDFVKSLEQLKLEKRILIISGAEDTDLYQKSQNVAKVTTKPLNELNAYMVMNADYVVFTESAVNGANEIWGI